MQLDKLHNSSRLLRAACAAVAASMRGEVSQFDLQAKTLVCTLQAHMRAAGTATSLEREIVGCDTGWLGQLVRDYPWLAEGTGMIFRAGRPKGKVGQKQSA